MLGCRREVVACGEALAGHWWRTASLALLEGSAARAGQARCSAALGGVRALGLEHGFCELASAGIGDFGRKKMREAAGHAVYQGRFVLPESKKPPVVVSDDGQELLFLGSVRLAHENNDFLPVKRFGRRFGCVELLAGLANFTQASSAMTTEVAACAMHMRRALVANSSLSPSSASESGINMSGPSEPIRNNVGGMCPLLCMQ